MSSVVGGKQKVVNSGKSSRSVHFGEVLLINSVLFVSISLKFMVIHPIRMTSNAGKSSELHPCKTITFKCNIVARHECTPTKCEVLERGQV